MNLFNGSSQEEPKSVLTAGEEHRKKAQVAEDRARRAVKVSSADRKARESALIVRSLIVGQSAITLSDAKAKPISRPKISKVKAELLQPKKANRLIAQLRALPSSSDVLPSATKLEVDHTHSPAHPIHAVCLPLTDAEADAQHFCRLTAVEPGAAPAPSVADVPEKRALSVNVTVALASVASVYNTSFAQLKVVLAEMHVLSLLTSDFGIGEPGDGPGLLAGAVPTAKTIIQGAEQITPELMSLGYVTGKALLPDHSGAHRFTDTRRRKLMPATGIHPPTDRMSVLTCEYLRSMF